MFLFFIFPHHVSAFGLKKFSFFSSCGRWGLSTVVSDNWTSCRYHFGHRFPLLILRKWNGLEKPCFTFHILSSMRDRRWNYGSVFTHPPLARASFFYQLITINLNHHAPRLRGKRTNFSVQKKKLNWKKILKEFLTALQVAKKPVSVTENKARAVAAQLVVSIQS